MSVIYVVYKTDVCHSYASRDVIGICDTLVGSVLVCWEAAKKEGFSFGSDDWHNLENINQTQGYEGEGEFVIEKFNKNVLL